MRAPRHMESSAGEAGVTLVELMISVLLFALLSAGAIAMLRGQQDTVRGQQKSSGALDNARAVLNSLGAQLRIVKSGMPEGRVAVGCLPGGLPLTATEERCGAAGGYETWVGTIRVQNNKDNKGPDWLRVIFPDGVVWSTVAAASPGVAAGDASVQVRTHDGAQPLLSAGELLVLMNFTKAALVQVTGGAACGTGDWCYTKDVGCAAWAGIEDPGPFPAPPSVAFRARALQYSISAGDPPRLMVQDVGTAGTSEPAAAGIEDLQVALGIDADDSGEVEDAEWINGEPAGTWGKCQGLDLLRAVRISIVARTTSAEPGAVSTPPVLEDHTPTQTTPDGYYRVVLQTVVAVR